MNNRTSPQCRPTMLSLTLILGFATMPTLAGPAADGAWRRIAQILSGDMTTLMETCVEGATFE